MDRAAIPDTAKKWLYALIGWNVFDIVLHIAVDQVEFLRVSGNVVAIALAVVVLMTGRRNARLLLVAIGAVLVLNTIFIVTQSKIAPVMVILIVGSCVLSYMAYQALQDAPVAVSPPSGA